MSIEQPYDLIVIGGGSAGLTAAGFGVDMGARVALVEKYRLGGECTWTGCVPSKSLVKVAKVAHLMRTADRFGLTPVDLKVNLKAAMDRVRGVVNAVYQDETPDALRADGVHVFLGAARFLDPHTLAVGETRLNARHVLIATGGHPVIPPVEGLDGVDCMTYETIWDLDILPDHLLVVGGGPIGCEIAQAFRRFGAGVTLLTSRDRVLPRDEPEASQLVGEVLEREGVDVRTNCRVTKAWQDDEGIHVMSGDEEVVGDRVFVAVGRRPNVAGLGLEEAGVAYTDRGIQVDERLHTSQKHIYAAGDCIGRHQFTHYAGWQAVVAARNALLPGSSKGIPQQVPWATFTDPEVAHAGLTEQEAREQHGDDVSVLSWPMARVDRARAEGDTEGFLKLIYRSNGAVVGATAVAERAGEMIQEWILAVDLGVKIADLSSVIHVYPTYATANWQASAEIRMEQMLEGASGRILRRLARFGG